MTRRSLGRVGHIVLVTALLGSGCLLGEDEEGSITATVGTIRGIDYAWSKPTSPQALRSAGYTFAARYLSYDTSGKNLTAAEAKSLISAGIDVVANWEWGANDALDGFSTGATQAKEALRQANLIGLPNDRPIYFSVDFDATPGQQAAIDSYFDGVISVLGVNRVGAYAGYYVIQRLFDHGKIKWGWQTYAWSGGQWDSRAQLRQVKNSVRVAGSDCDIDEAAAPDFGQWGTSRPSSAPVPAEGSQAYLVPDQQHLMMRTAAGELRHLWWDRTNTISRDTWGTGIAGTPVTLVTGDDQHAFARGTGGTLEHWFWGPKAGLAHNTWGTGIAGDPAAIVVGAFQDVWAVDTAGKLQHWWWGASTSGVQHDTWGSGVVGRPTALLSGAQQHVFARGTGGTLEHWWWDNGTISHDTWATGIAGDPAALAIGDFQAVWAVDTAGKLQHWWWGPQTNGVQHDTWGSGAAVGRPSVLLSGPQQHAFARGTGGTLEHWWWDTNGVIMHDTWGQSIVGDATAELINSQQHVWAQDSAGVAQHWYWDPAANAIKHDNWGQ